MSLEEDRNSRDYLFGRLLAIAEKIEGYRCILPKRLAALRPNDSCSASLTILPQRGELSNWHFTPTCSVFKVPVQQHSILEEFAR